jgi:Co/Zn/Cd efflux system component
MDSCCETKSAELGELRNKHKNVLAAVLVINAALFVIEAVAGLLANSTALLADSLDMLGDSLVFGFSLYVLWRNAEWKAKAALLKGSIMAVFGAGVLLEAIYKTVSGIVPSAETMGIIGGLVLLGNGICFLLLLRHRADDLNMRSTWLSPGTTSSLICRCWQPRSVLKYLTRIGPISWSELRSPLYS